MRQHNGRNRIISFCISCTLVNHANAWAGTRTSAAGRRTYRSTSKLNSLVPEAAASILAGSIAGAMGVGVAFPLDTLKTKQQVEAEKCSRIEYVLSPAGTVTIRAVTSNLFTTIVDTWNDEGPGGFYGGVRTSMAGQAVIKATAFGVNNAVLHAGHDLATAAATAGLATAFLACPVDRIKVLMQTGSFDAESECVRSVLRTEGASGLLTTGLVPTLFREVPAYTLYFYLYGRLAASSLLGTDVLGAMAPLVDGALAGAACVVPVHPVDVVKTIVQHSGADWREVVREVYERQGPKGFWEGLSPRVGRAAVNHSVTFAAYEALLHTL
mmetsp:Transcript_16396/g.35651  ORF Transcript_16396/g.35651 Transcript_16396/m.35651 type:complete len:326 (-) Transcript_16396:77-1054(-)